MMKYINHKNKIQKLIKQFALIAILFSFSACSDFLDLEPETSLSSAVAFDNIQGIEAGINGAYSTLHSDWVERQYVFSEVLAGNVKEVNALGNTNYSKALRHEVWSDVYNVANYLWTLSYRAMDLTNNVIEAIPNIEEANGQIKADKDRLLGEALYLRGMVYFVLNRFFGQPQNGLSVPILTTPFNADDKPIRATIDEVKAQAIADLKAAEELLTSVESNNGRANIWAVRALLARVYFEYKDYDNAADYANQVINSGKFSLTDGDVGASFSTTISTENIFTFQGIATDRAASNLFDIFSLNSNAVQLSVSDSFWPVLSSNGNNDLRLTVLHEDFMTARAVHKYDDRDMNLPYIRLPEMYLIRAECRANKGELDNALADLNRLRERAGNTETDYTDKNDLLEKIYLDRTLELSMEGDNLHNLKRLERSIGGYPWDEARFKLVFFLPEKEIQLNSNLIQNDLW